MSHFEWDETAAIEFFGTLPMESHDNGRNLSFKVTQSIATLALGVNLDTSDCSVTLHVAGLERPVFQAVYLGSPGARIVNDKRGHYLELGSPGSFSGQYDGIQPLASGVRIQLQPQLAIAAFVA